MTVEKIYHVETQEDYDSLMIELESKGYMWKNTHNKPTEINHWVCYNKHFCICVNDNMLIEFSGKIFYENDGDFKHIPIETYKASKELTFVSWFDKQKVEKEKLYTVRLTEDIALVKVAGEVMLVDDFGNYPNDSCYGKLTEQEIKDYDEGYWVGGFAKEVTE